MTTKVKYGNPNKVNTEHINERLNKSAESIEIHIEEFKIDLSEHDVFNNNSFIKNESIL